MVGSGLAGAVRGQRQGGFVMHVAGILNDKGNVVVTMGPRSTVKEAIALMAQRRIGAVVVVGVEHSVLGMFSERDVVRVLAQKGPEALADDLARHMTSPVFTCTPQTLIDEIMQLMTSKKFRHVPVVDGGALSGLVSIGDVVKFRLAEIETEHKAMRDYIASA
jgi:CBS domain-containing protein